MAKTPNADLTIRLSDLDTFLQKTERLRRLAAEASICKALAEDLKAVAIPEEVSLSNADDQAARMDAVVEKILQAAGALQALRGAPDLPTKPVVTFPPTPSGRKRTPVQSVVLEYLGRNRGRAFTGTEIAEANSLSPASVAVCLSNLKKKGNLNNADGKWSLP